MKRLVVVLVVLSCRITPAWAADLRDPTDCRRVIFLIDTTRPSISDGIRPPALTRALCNYAEYAAFKRGWEFVAILSDESQSIDTVMTEDSGPVLAVIALDCRLVCGSGTDSPDSFREPIALEMLPANTRLVVERRRWEPDAADAPPVRHDTLSLEGPPSHHVYGTTPDPAGTRTSSLAAWQQLLQEVISVVMPPYQGRRQLVYTGESMPCVVMVDSRLANTWPSGWEAGLRDLLGYASYALSPQFGVRLQAARILLVAVSSDVGSPLYQIHRLVRDHTPAHGDTLVVMLYVLDTGATATQFGYAGELGLADVGKRLITVGVTPPRDEEQHQWWAFYAGLVLLHEFGHALGGIHVGDMYSVMNSTVTGVASHEYDPANARIIREALEGQLAFDSLTTYLSAMSNTLRSVDYGLADYPGIIHDYLAAAAGSPTADWLRAAVEHQPFLLAADAFGLLEEGRRAEAARLLRQALRQTPHQASLYYYLALAVDDEQSEAALRKAAQLGYYPAILEQMRR